MKKYFLTVLLLAIALALLAAGAAAAEGQTDPNRKDMAAFEQTAEELRAILASQPAVNGTVQSNDSGYGLNVTCYRQPALNGTGYWGISLASHSASQVSQMIIYLGYKDWCSSYTHVHWIKKSRDEGDTDPFMSSYVSCKFVTAGDYELMFYVTFTDGSTAWYVRDFTISGTNALKNKIASVAAACKGETKWETAVNLHDWLVTHMYYDLTYQYYGADSILRGYGVCDSYSKIYLMLCRAAGITARRVTNDGHAWNAIYLGGNWYYVDCTWDDPAGVDEPVSGYEHHTYFCVNDTQLGSDHPTPWEWADDTRQKCTSLKANYYIYTGEWKNWGQNYSYDYDTGAWSVVTFLEEIGNAFDNGDTELTLDQTVWWEPSGDDDIHSVSVDVFRLTCLEYALNRTGVPLETGDEVTVSAVWNTGNNTVDVELTGWNIKEKGTLKLPKGITNIPAYAFRKCRATSLVIRKGCKTIGSKAFENSCIRTVIVPASVTSIAEDAFDDCDRIIFITQNSVAKRYARKHGFLVLDP